MIVRRLARLLVLWFALFSVAAPVVTCASAAVQRGPCCPEEGTPPCGECPAPVKTHSAAVYCTTAPAAAARSLATDSQTRFFALELEPAIVATPAAADAFAAACEFQPGDEPRLPEHLSSPTWLLTGRLRL